MVGLIFKFESEFYITGSVIIVKFLKHQHWEGVTSWKQPKTFFYKKHGFSLSQIVFGGKYPNFYINIFCILPSV